MTLQERHNLTNLYTPKSKVGDDGVSTYEYLSLGSWEHY